MWMMSVEMTMNDERPKRYLLVFFFSCTEKRKHVDLATDGILEESSWRMDALGVNIDILALYLRGRETMQ